ncbi:hypothetical protein [Treponema sp. R6D11]
MFQKRATIISQVCSLIIVLLICAVNICCAHKETTNSSANEKYVVLKNKYAALPYSVMVDKKITKDAADMIFKRFEAIEKGDIAAFRATLGQMEDGVDYYYQLGLICEFFGDFFDIDYDTFHDAVADGSEKLTEIAHTLFYGEHPLKSRNTGLVIKIMEVTDSGGLKVTTTNNKKEEIIYNFSYW